MFGDFILTFLPTFKTYQQSERLKIIFLVGILKVTDEKSKQDPDPYQNITDPEHWFTHVDLVPVSTVRYSTIRYPSHYRIISRVITVLCT